MTITQLQSALSTLAIERGYQPIITDKEMLCENIDCSQIAWLKSPELIEREGVKKGRDRYKIELALLIDKTQQNKRLAQSTMDKLQGDILEIMTDLTSYEGIVEARNIRIRPSFEPLTKLGDISQNCTAEVVCYF